MGLFGSISSCFSNYVKFSGRASRSEFWWWQLFITVVVLGLALTGPGAILVVALFLPTLAVDVRRLHDIEKSGWFILLYPIPVIGLILFFVWNCRAGSDGTNDYGASPLNNTPAPSLRNRPLPLSLADRTEQLSRIKALLESGAISQLEFDRLKGELLAG